MTEDDIITVRVSYEVTMTRELYERFQQNDDTAVEEVDEIISDMVRASSPTTEVIA